MRGTWLQGLCSWEVVLAILENVMSLWKAAERDHCAIVLAEEEATRNEHRKDEGALW